MINEIADKIRELRKKKNLTLKDLSEKTGLSVSFLSQVENNSSSLAITSLKKIADALDVSMGYFFTEPMSHNFLVKDEDQKVFQIGNSNSKFVRLSGTFPERNMEAMMVIIPAEQKHGDKYGHIGEEFIYVLEGVIILNLDGKEFIAKKGESIHFPSTFPHILVNPLQEDAKILTIVQPVLF